MMVTQALMLFLFISENTLVGKKNKAPLLQNNPPAGIGQKLK